MKNQETLKLIIEQTVNELMKKEVIAELASTSSLSEFISKASKITEETTLNTINKNIAFGEKLIKDMDEQKEELWLS